MSTVKTKKGSVLPLLKLKGKDYLQVAHRLQWLSDDYENYTISTQFIESTDLYAICRSTITTYDKDGKVIRQTTGTKQESKKDFADFMEKAETGSIGRALAMMGLGTQHALADLDEGERIVDSPVVNPKEASQETVAASESNGAAKKKTSFRKTTAAPESFPTDGSSWS